MTKEAIFTMEIETALCEKFIAAAEAELRPAPAVVRDLMRHYIERHEYRHFHEEKIIAARQEMAAAKSHEQIEVKAIFAARRVKVKGNL